MAFVWILAAVPALVGAAVLWEESINGELSNDLMNPTGLPILVPATNDIIGSLDQALPPGDDDAAAFNVLPNQTVTQIILVGLGGGEAMAVGLFDGPDATSPLLFATGLVGRDAGMNIFDLIPFAGPLAPGSYMLLFEQTQFDASPYEISLVVDQTPIPLPLPVVLHGIGARAVGADGSRQGV